MTVRPIAITMPKEALNSCQSQEVSAQPERGVVERLCRSVQVIGANEPDESIAQIASLQQNKNNENDDDSGRRQRRQKGGDNASQNLDRAGSGLVHLDLHERMI